MNLQDVLDRLLRLVDDEHDGAVLFGADWVGDWPPGLLDELLARGLLQPAEPARFVRCPGCHDDHVEQVEYVSYADEFRAFVHCPELGRALVVPETLLRWRVDGAGLASAIRDSLGLSGHLTEKMQGRVWHLGYRQFGEAAATVFFVRGLGWADAAEVPAEHGLRIVLTPGDAPSAAFAGDMIVVGLLDLASLSGGTLSIDRAALEARVRPVGISRLPSPPYAEPHVPIPPRALQEKPAARKQGGRPRLEDDAGARQLYERGEQFRRDIPTITRAQIAARLGLSPSTYKRYVSRFRQPR